MLTFSKFGRKGRLGNQLFQLASMIGLCHTHNQQMSLPTWNYSRYFNVGTVLGMWKGRAANTVEESSFHYDLGQWSALAEGDHDVDGWLQSEKYWEHCLDQVRTALQWEPGFRAHVLGTVRELPDLSRAIAISVRRGDYVGNPNYVLLPPSYYIQALMQEFPDWMERPVLIFSDDMAWCRIHFECVPGAWFADGLTDIVQLLLMSECSGHVIANSTFSWWGAYLAELRDPGVKVVRPAHLFAGPLLESSDSKDHWPGRWHVYDHVDAGGNIKKYDLKDVTFTIPVYYDHDDRKHNLELVVCMLQRWFDTNIMIREIVVAGENKAARFEYMSRFCDYDVETMPYMHRTKALNDMAVAAKTDIIANWDADVVVPEAGVVVAVSMIRAGSDMVYPFDGRFARVARRQWFGALEKALDPGIFKNERFKGSFPSSNSVGGAVLWNRASFLTVGGENEHMISYAPEDAERYDRAKALGLDVRRVTGQLFHIDHWKGPNSGGRHGYMSKNRDELGRVRTYIETGNIKGLWDYIETWPWRRQWLESGVVAGAKQVQGQCRCCDGTGTVTEWRFPFQKQAELT